MLDAKTISATLMVGLLGCGAGKTNTDAANTNATSTATPETNRPSASAVPTVTSVASSEVSAQPLPGGRLEPLPPKDKKPIASKQESVRKGAEACCGEGTCGECPALPANRTAPKPPKDGKVVPASQSKRKGTEACCGEGSCSAC